jgi:hypothetical protein
MIFHGPKTQYKSYLISKFHSQSAHSKLRHDLYQSGQSSKCCLRPYSGKSVKNKLHQQNMSTMRPKNGQIFSRESQGGGDFLTNWGVKS